MSVDAWKAMALGEAAAVYGYGVLAAQLPDGAERDRATDLIAAHSRDRDRARAQLAALQADPQAPAAFEIPFPLDSPAAARRLAALLESRLVDVYCSQVPAFDEPEQRRYPAQRAAEASARAVRWGATPVAFPGGADAIDQPAISESGDPSPTSSAPSGSPAATSSPTPAGDGAVVTG